MSQKTIFSNQPLALGPTAPQTVTAKLANAQFDLSLTCPAVNADQSFVGGAIEVSGDGGATYDAVQSFNFQGGLNRVTGLPGVFDVAGQVTDNEIGHPVRLNITTLVGAWTATLKLTLD